MMLTDTTSRAGPRGPARAAQALVGVTQTGKDGAQLARPSLPLGRERDALGRAAKQSRAEIVFQRPHLVTDRRLGDAELRGSTREARVPCRHLEGEQSVERRKRLGAAGTISLGHEFFSYSMEKIRSRASAARATCWCMKLFRLRYSAFARKVQMLLDLLGRDYELVEINYGERSQLAELTGGYIYVPVLVADDGNVITESRHICERLLTGAAARQLVPSPLEGPIWAYHDFCDGPLEDVLFRIASPAIRQAWSTVWERALFNLTKERKFGAGCVDSWLKDQPALLERARHLLAPTLSTLEQRPFLFGALPTLADAALYGNLAMLSEADPALLRSLSPGLAAYAQRLEEARPKR